MTGRHAFFRKAATCGGLLRCRVSVLFDPVSSQRPRAGISVFSIVLDGGKA
ncbi:hypothetical protein Agau_C100175 [Agrobacterium tumefaciens F2]|jgi:hypothetical protein|nr:hypothetical protein Agau_C100175 [Agrobacterium tumefaciens F2]